MEEVKVYFKQKNSLDYLATDTESLISDSPDTDLVMDPVLARQVEKNMLNIHNNNTELKNTITEVSDRFDSFVQDSTSPTEPVDQEVGYYWFEPINSVDI